MQDRRMEEKKKNLQLQSITRLTNIPIIEAGWNYAGRMYTRVKNSNSIVHWTLGTAESSLHAAMETFPAGTILGGPVSVIDKLLCKSLDVMEQRVPSIYLPPQVMYWNTKQYVLNNKYVCPVLKRADSVKEFGNSMLASKYTAFAADKLDSALNVADMYVDKYLPDTADQAFDDVDNFKNAKIEGPAGKAVHTMQHVDRFSRKLQRRLTRRTLAEAKALKERSQESIHVLLYVAELIAKDPKLALEKARKLWETLSEDEPENQLRPATLEQLIVMLTRESARRVVHLINFTKTTVSKLPDVLTHTVHTASSQCMQLVNVLLKASHLEEMSNVAISGVKGQTTKFTTVVNQINSYANIMLERLAYIIVGQPKFQDSNRKLRNNNRPIKPAQTQSTLQPPATKPHKQSFYNVNSSISNGSQGCKR